MNIEFVKTNPEHFARTVELNVLENVIVLASKKYYSEEPIISDQVYDILMDELDTRDKSNKLLNKIGYKTLEDKALLPYFMGSMNKLKTKASLLRWISKYSIYDNFIISDKLDGISALYDNKTNKLYTRGNGEYGRDISILIKYLNIPNLNDKIVVRGELIISKNNFEKNRGEYISARTMSNGLISLKESNTELIKLLDFVVFEVIEPQLAPFDQLEYIKKYGFKTPNYKLVNYNNIIYWKNDKDNYVLNTLNSYKHNSDYDIDGIILTHSKLYSRVKGNPKNSVAFKSNNYGKVTTIKDIEWNSSKYGILIPRIRFETVDLGSIVEYCTGFSGKFIFNNCLGPGSIIRVILSGDVIPYIIEIIKSTYPKMPEIGYNWGPNKLHCKIIDGGDDLKKKQILHFIKTIKIDYLSVGLINKLYDNGFTTVNSIINISKKDLLGLDGFKETLSSKIIDSIKKVTSQPIYLGLLMVASLKFNSGMGLKKIKKILDNYPYLMEHNITLDQILKIDGFQVKTATQFLDNIEHFKTYFGKLNLEYYVNTSCKIINKNPNINGKYFVLTGFRDELITQKIEENGGILQNDVNMKTDYLIVKNLETKSSKVTKAEIMGVEILVKDGFDKL